MHCFLLNNIFPFWFCEDYFRSSGQEFKALYEKDKINAIGDSTIRCSNSITVMRHFARNDKGFDACIALAV